MDQFGLFQEIDNTEPINVINLDGECDYYPNFLNNTSLLKIKNLIEWRQDQITLYGKTHNVPRLHCWYNDQNQSYTYSNITLNPLKFFKELDEIRTKVELSLGQKFNSCLCNLYRDGNDYAAIHSDDEKELGKNPMIASISIGESRKFILKHRFDKGIERKEVILEDQSLLVMKGKLQHYWKHELTKTKKKIGPRVNLTFRNIIS